MSSELKNNITHDMKTAMREKDKMRLSTIRMALAAMKQIEVDERKELSNTDVLHILDKMIKQRRDAAQQYQAAGREELAAVENAEIDILQTYMPAPLSDDELAKLIDDAITQVGETGMAAMGKVMGVLKPQVQGRADMGKISSLVREKLV